MLNFREFFEESPHQKTQQVLTLYFQQPDKSVREISKITGKSIGEIYRILHDNGKPNRFIHNHENVKFFANSGMKPEQVANLTGYTPRNIRYILKKAKHD